MNYIKGDKVILPTGYKAKQESSDWAKVDSLPLDIPLTIKQVTAGGWLILAEGKLHLSHCPDKFISIKQYYELY